jgi:membrane protease YdiL (CAAX protease family)
MGLSGTLVLFSFSFILYFLYGNSNKMKQWFNKRYKFDRASSYYVFSYKIFGLLIFGIVPFTINWYFLGEEIFKLNYLLPSHPISSVFYLITLLIILCVLTIVYFNSKSSNKELLQLYPQVRSHVWNNETVFLYVSGWLIYLISYEYIFRGFLLYSLIHSIGYWPGILLNTILYALVHIPKGKNEALASIPFGLLMCILTYSSGILWFSVIIHFVMAISNSYLAFQKQEKMVYKT